MININRLGELKDVVVLGDGLTLVLSIKSISCKLCCLGSFW